VELIAIFAELGISPAARAENLSLAQFAKITAGISAKIAEDPARHKHLTVT
jgi:hypothetical protein